MKLNPADFNRFLAHMGQSVAWRASFVCPCLQEFSGAAQPDCPICHGKGRTWGAPVRAVIGVTGQSVHAKTEGFGAFEAGDVTLTIPSNSPVYGAGRFDRIVLLNATDVFSRMLTRGVNDHLADLSVKTLTRVFWRSLDRTALVEGSLPGVGDGGALAWGIGAPAAGVRYSITGVAFVEYFLYDEFPSNRNEHQGAPLPRRVQARKFDLFGR